MQELRQVAERRQGGYGGGGEPYQTPPPQQPSAKMQYATDAQGDTPGASNKLNSVDVLKCVFLTASAD